VGGSHVPSGAFIRALNALTGEALVVMTLNERRAVPVPLDLV
jgi:hypothetical protein